TLLVGAVAEKENRYKTIYLSNSSYTYFVFANKISIQELQKSYPRRFNPMFDIGKYVFVNEDCYILPRENRLFVIKSATCELSSKQKKMYKRVGIVRFKDNNPAYTFYQYIPPELTVVKVK
ncbi:MAG TPA: hypothetical protein VLF89_03995, partial [Candidatus Saccharimonadales bacterium]|nr:hypothetical protein [Candidatus Saccharimonadales bacterium]